jgi:hypothetical protein
MFEKGFPRGVEISAPLTWNNRTKLRYRDLQSRKRPSKEHFNISRPAGGIRVDALQLGKNRAPKLTGRGTTCVESMNMKE